MAAFTIIAKITTSQDGKTLTYNDQSLYDNNDEGYGTGSFTSRVITVKDSLDNTLGTIILTGAQLTGTFAITKDGTYTFIPVYITGEDVPQTITTRIDFLARQIYNQLQLIYTTLITCGCGCSSKASEFAYKALECVYAAITDFNFSDLVAAQTAMDFANININSSLK